MNNHLLISQRVSYDGTTSSDYQIGFNESQKEYTTSTLQQSYRGRQKLVIRFPEAVQKQDNGLSSYLEQPRSYMIGAIETGEPVIFKTYFHYSDLGWYNISNSRLTDLRWQFENQLLSGGELNQQTESKTILILISMKDR